MMSQARFDIVSSGVTSVAKKVYAAVPIAQSWSAQQIVAELTRVGVSQDFRVVSGCLNSLIGAGLVRETGKGLFCREPIRPSTKKLTIVPTEEPLMKPTAAAVKPSAVPAPASALDRLAQLSVRLVGLSQALREIGDELSDAAIDIETQQEHNDADLGKLKQLHALLKSLGDQ